MIFLSKLLPQFIFPLGLISILVLLTLILWKNRAVAKATFIFALVFLIVSGSKYAALPLAKSLEWQYFPPNPVPEVDAIVVLGGGTEPMISPRPMVEINAAGDRVIYAAKLAKDQPQAMLILSGGDIDFLDQSSSTPATDMAALMALFGIPSEQMIIQANSQNTAEDAAKSCEIIKEKKFENVLLVTSAMHMPRAMMLFEKEGCTVIPAPTDYTVTNEGWNRLWHPNAEEIALNIVPNYSNLSLITKSLKEYIGIAMIQLQK
jgi:uncharacterized SAM-binding protein YcdF (DUF218 family)